MQVNDDVVQVLLILEEAGGETWLTVANTLSSTSPRYQGHDGLQETVALLGSMMRNKLISWSDAKPEESQGNLSYYGCKRLEELAKRVTWYPISGCFDRLEQDNPSPLLRITGSGLTLLSEE